MNTSTELPVGSEDLVSTVSELSTFSPEEDILEPPAIIPSWIMDLTLYTFGIVGIVGNGFVLLVMLWNSTLRRRFTNYFVINQSLTDWPACLFLILNAHYATREDLSNLPYGSAYVYCFLWNNRFFYWYFLKASTLNLVALTLERYTKVVHPFIYHKIYSRKTMYFWIAAVWILALVWLSSYVFPTSDVQDGHCKDMAFWPSQAVRKMTGIINTMIGFFFPVATMTYCYSRILYKIRQQNQTVAAHGDAALAPAGNPMNDTSRRMRNNTIRTFLIVSLTFVLCWILNQVLFLCLSLGADISPAGVLYQFSIIMVEANCCINPLIYATKYRQFNDGVKKIFGLKSMDPSTITTPIN